MANVSYQLKFFRELNNLSQKQVADALEITPSAYNHYESGARTPGADVLEKLAKLYNLEEPILGVYKSSTSASSPLNKYSITDIINNTQIDLSLQSNQRTLIITKNQFAALCKYFEKIDEKKEKLLNEIATSKAGNDGKIYEALVYSWLDAQGIQFTPQVTIRAEDCLKRTDYDADGILDECCIFDVKMFGLSHPNIERLKEKLNSLCMEEKPDYYITISGQLDVSNDILQSLLRDSAKLYAELFNENNKLHTNYVYRTPNAHLKICAHYMKGTRVISSVSEINPYKWAEENQFYFFHDASQFCINKPYVIICPYDSKIAPHFANGFSDSTRTAFRSLCRRMFFGLPDGKYAQDYDKKCLPLISIKEASECISAVIFQNISMSPGLDDDTWIFINPNARNKMPRYLADSFMLHNSSMLDNFAYDLY